jgi:hypothetical protein
MGQLHHYSPTMSMRRVVRAVGVVGELTRHLKRGRRRTHMNDTLHDGHAQPYSQERDHDVTVQVDPFESKLGTQFIIYRFNG